jgi:hypothetical protein
MKLALSGGASVLASRGDDCGVPKEHLKIARHFNAGFVCKSRQVPKGRPTSEHWFRKSLRNFALFAIALILLAAISATAQTTNTLTDAEIQGRQLDQKLLDQQPTENFTNTGVLQIRDAEGNRSEIPIKFDITVTGTNWRSTYHYYAQRRINNDETNFENITLVINHALKEANHYSIEEISGYFDRAGAAMHVVDGQYEPDLTKPVANSDFCVGDLGLEFLHWPLQKVLHGDTARGRLCKVLESTNPYRLPNGEFVPGTYSRVDSWIDNETPGILHAEAYDANGKLLKVFDPKSFKKVNGQWEIQDMEIRNVQTGSRTRLEFDLNK